MCGFYQKFIPQFNILAAPLTDLTQKDKPDRVQWTGDCERAFQQLKATMTAKPVLQLPDLEQPFTLRTDASNQGLGAALLQADPEDITLLKPVAYASRKLRGGEKNYAAVEKECLALVWAIQKFQKYLYGTHFSLQCDHQPLSFLATAQQTNARVMRWALLLQPYSFRVEYLPGKANTVADFLSRHPCEPEETEKKVRTAPARSLDPNAATFQPCSKGAGSSTA